MSETVLRAEGVRKSYLSGTRAIEVLRGVDLDLARGDTISIRGASGSGKTTLIHILAGLEDSDGGRLFWKEKEIVGRDRTKLARHRAEYIGMVFQAFYLIPELNAVDNVLMAARMLGRPDRRARARAANLLERVGLADRAAHLPSQLSGGEMQRVAVARALINRPALIMADEPTGNLDELTGTDVMTLLLDVCREENASLILVTHNPEHARRTTRQYRLHLGLLEEGEAAAK